MVSNENLGISNKNPGVSNEKIGVSDENMGVFDETVMGSPLKGGGLCYSTPMLMTQENIKNFPRSFYITVLLKNFLIFMHKNT